MGLSNGMSYCYKSFSIPVGLWTCGSTSLGIKLDSRHVSLQDQLTADDYQKLMSDELEDLTCHWLRALEAIEANKARVARHFEKEGQGQKV